MKYGKFAQFSDLNDFSKIPEEIIEVIINIIHCYFFEQERKLINDNLKQYKTNKYLLDLWIKSLRKDEAKIKVKQSELDLILKKLESLELENKKLKEEISKLRKK